MFQAQSRREFRGQNRCIRLINVAANDCRLRRRLIGHTKKTSGFTISKDNRCGMAARMTGEPAKPGHLLAALAATAEPFQLSGVLPCVGSFSRWRELYR